jgi:adenine phosphoribosyltransferase|tara:strand:+ start:1614 stop:2135 length:522 start_codon:yes stop_codon:yes gene_type:complete
MSKEKNYKDYINEIQDFPTEGVSFKDISPLLKHGNMYRLALMDMLQGHNNDLWAGIESRGFLIASGLSQINGGGIVLIRKKDKLPPPVCSTTFKTEYSYESLEIQPNTAEHRQSVVLVDDVLATGGTLKASYDLLIQNGYDVVGIGVLIDLLYLHEKDFNIEGHKVSSVIQYE